MHINDVRCIFLASHQIRLMYSLPCSEYPLTPDLKSATLQLRRQCGRYCIMPYNAASMCSEALLYHMCRCFLDSAARTTANILHAMPHTSRGSDSRRKRVDPDSDIIQPICRGHSHRRVAQPNRGSRDFSRLTQLETINRCV